MQWISPFLLGLSMATGMVFSGSALAADQPEKPVCLDEKAARRAVREQKLRTLPEAIAQLRQQISGDVVSANLCRNGDGMIYIFAVMAEGGRVHRIQIDAMPGTASSH